MTADNSAPPAEQVTADDRKMPRSFLQLSIAMGVSMVGTQGTAFAFSVWTVERPFGATWWSIVLFASYAGAAAASFLIGRFLDSFGSARALHVCLWGGLITTSVELVLLAIGVFEPWMLVGTTLVSGAVAGVQQPAYAATTAWILPRAQLSRGQGIVGTISSVALVVAPALAGALLAIGSIPVVLLVDVVSFLIALVLYGLLSLPRKQIVTASGDDAESAKESRSMRVAWDYIAGRRHLLVLAFLLPFTTLMLSTRYVLRAPMVLGRAEDGTQVLALVQGIGAIGGILGGLALAYRPPKRLDGLVVGAGLVLAGLAGQALTGLNHPVLWCVGTVVINFTLPAVGGIAMALFQAQCPDNLRGRVASLVAGMLAIANPVAVLLAGPFANHPGQALAEIAVDHGVTIFGSDPIAGVSLTLVGTGVAAALAGAAALTIGPFRRASSRAGEATD
jgi:MFS family permease